MKKTGSFLFSLLFSVAVLFMAGCGELTEAEHMDRAREFQAQEKWPAAIIELKSALQKNPNNGEARWLLGLIYLEAGQGPAAEKELSKAIELGFDAPSQAVELGRALLLQREYQRVLNEITPQGLPSTEDQAVVLRMLGDANRELGGLERGCKFYQESLQLDSKHIPTYWGLAFCAYSEDDSTGARKFIDTALQIAPDNAQTWVFLGEWELAEGNNNAAIEAYSSALKFDPAHTGALLKRATIYTFSDKQDEAQADIKKLYSVRGGKVWAQFAEGWLSYLQGDLEKSLGLAQEVNQAFPDFLPVRLLLGSIYFDTKSYSQAIQNLSAYLRLVPAHLNARKLLAAAYVQVGDADSALELLTPYINANRADAQIMRLAGAAYLSSDDPSSAEQIYEKAIELMPMNLALKADLGLARLASGREQEGIDALQALSALESGDYSAETALAYYFLDKKEYVKALAIIDRLEQKLPTSPGPHNLRGVVLTAQSDLVAAKKSFSRALELQPELTSAGLRLAAIESQGKDMSAAREQYNAILERDSKNVAAMVGLAELASLEGDDSQVLSWLKKATAAQPAAVVPRLMLTNYYVQKGDDNQALTEAREVLAAAPDRPEALGLLARVQLKTGDYAGAVSSYSRLAEMQSGMVEVRYHLATAYAAMEKLEEARKSLQAALEIDPGFSKAQVALSALNKNSGKHKEALEFARKLQNRAADSATGFILEGDAWEAAGSWHQAVQAYESALQKQNDSSIVSKIHYTLLRSGDSVKADARVSEWLRANPEALQLRLYFANSLAQRRHTKQAIEQYETLLVKAPNVLMALNNLAVLYGEQGDVRALKTAEKAFQLQPENSETADTLGWILIQKGDVSRGLELLEKAAAAVPDNSVYRYHLAYALNAAGDKARAKREIEGLKAMSLPSALEQQVLSLSKQLNLL